MEPIAKGREFETRNEMKNFFKKIGNFFDYHTELSV